MEMRNQNIAELIIKNSGNLPVLPQFDAHVHSPYSTCCKDITYEKLKEKATEKNILYALTDHSSHLYFPREEVWSFWTLSNDEFKNYFKRYKDSGRKKIGEYLEKTRANAPYVGIEIDFFPDGTIIFDDDFLGEFDIVVGAAHFLPSIRNKDSFDKVISEFKYVTNSVLSSGIVNILAHPLRVLGNNNLTVNDELIDWTVKLCAEKKIALELNSHYKFPENDQRMLSAAKKYKANIVFGTDAHTIKEFADFSYHENLISKVLS